MTTYLVVLAVLAGLGGLALGVYALMRVRSAADDCRELVERLLPEGSGLDTRAVRDVAVVRYDALEEMSGARSFSLALLNAAGDGVVVTSINGRTESRTYAKEIEQGRAEEALSPEEYRAVRAARLGRGPGSVPGGDPAARAAPRADEGGSRRRRDHAAPPRKDPAPERDAGAAPDAPAESGRAGKERAPAATGPDPDTPAVRSLGAAPSGAPASGTSGAAD
ncbi:DUF4446 family protein [Streptomonospora sp. PA3]|nr:DUF4446 family protein [Streptomonospora sp. PA3]